MQRAHNASRCIDHTFSENLKAIGPELPDADFLSSCDVIVFALPTQSMR